MTAISPTPGTFHRRRVAQPNKVLAVASLGVVLAFIDATIVNVAFPDIRADFPGTSLDGLSWILNGYNIAFAAFLIAAGRIADVLGRRRLFSFGVVVFTLASALCALAPSVEALVAARVLQGFGAAVIVPTSLALVLEAFGAERRAHAVTLWSASAVVAAGIGPSLGGVLVELGGWRLVFLVNIPLGAVAVALAGSAMIESRAPGRRRMPDLAGAVLVALGTAALVAAIVKGGDWGWLDPLVLAGFAIAAVALALFARRTASHRSPMIDLELLRSRSVRVGNAQSLVGAAGFFAYTLCNVLFLTAVWDYSVLQAGLALTPGPLVAAVVARPAQALAERVGTRVMIVVGASFWAAGVLYLATVVGTTPNFTGEWLPGMVILGIGAGITFPLVGAVAVAHAPGVSFATASSLQSVSRQLGAALGVALLVAIVGTPDAANLAAAFDRGWLFAAGCFACVALATPLIGPLARTSAIEVESGVPARLAFGPGPARQRHLAPRAVDARRPRTTLDALAATPLFADLDPAALERLAARARTRELEAGEWLLREGDPPDSLFVLATGRLEARVGPEAEELVNVLQPGAVIGELGLLSGDPRAASIRARRDSRVLELTAEEFDALLNQDSVSRVLLATMAAQLQRSRARVTTGGDLATTLAVVPVQRDGVFAEVAGTLADVFAEHGSARLDGDPGEAAAALEALEREYDRVLLIADSPDPNDAWRAFCIRQADRVLAVADSRPPAVDPPSSLLGCDLLWVDGTPGTMAPWLDAIEPRASYVLRRDDLRGSVEAVVRRLVGQSLGLVLSGGGARAFAHVGVIDELLRAGVPIDRVAGVSMGAFVGGMFAAGMGAEEIDARCYEGWVRENPLRDYRFPRHSLVRGERIRTMLGQHLPGEIEELQRSFACLATDLRTGEGVVFRRGPLSAAVGPSLNLPGIGPPERSNGRLLVDGGLTSNLPLPLLDRAEGPIIACDAVAGRSARGEKPRDVSNQRLPGIGEVLLRAALVGGVEATREARRRADLLIAPDDVGVGMLEWHQIDVAIDAGRRAAVKALEDHSGDLFAAPPV